MVEKDERTAHKRGKVGEWFESACWAPVPAGSTAETTADTAADSAATPTAATESDPALKRRRSARL